MRYGFLLTSVAIRVVVKYSPSSVIFPVVVFSLPLGIAIAKKNSLRKKTDLTIMLP